MEQLRDVLNGTWVGSYGYEGRFQTIRTDTRFRLDCKISPSTGKLEITGKGNDFTGNFSFEGSATSPTEIRMTKLIGWLNNWWHTAKVDIDKKEMQGQWGPAWYPNKIDGSLIFQRQMTQEEIQREADAARQRADEARKKQEEAAAAAARKNQEEAAAEMAARQNRDEEAAGRKKQEEAARKEQEEGAAKAAAKQRQDEAAAARKKQEEEAAEAAARQKRDEEEVARKKPEEENEEAAKKQREDADAARQKAEEVNAASKKRAEQAVQPDLATKDAKRARQREAKQASQKGKKAQMTDRMAKPVVSMTDCEDGVAGKLKIHLKLDLDADIRVIATLRGDVAIGIM
jgi:pyruvate/2-oxoglutarate dehydrogenase complex dihydrolipoamide acyltransferase (E2) component